MKKIFAISLAAAMLLAAPHANAQLSAGAGYLNSQEKANTKNAQRTDLNGFYAGAQYNIHLVAGLGVAPGLYVDMLFGKEESGNAAVSVAGKYTELALNVPVNFNYSFALGRDMKVFVYAGPVFQYGLLSRTKVGASVGGKELSETVNNYEKDYRNPFNIYLGGGAGIDVAGIQVILGYDHSLLNAYGSALSDNASLGRSQIKVGVGYAF